MRDLVRNSYENGFELSIVPSEEPLLEWAICDMDTLEWLWSEDWNKYWRPITRLRDFWEKLSEVYGSKIDPIQYLIYLYFEVKLNYEEMYEEAAKIGIDYENQRSLHGMLSKVLGWSFRRSENMTEEKRKQQSEKTRETREQNNRRVLAENSTVFWNAVAQILGKELEINTESNAWFDANHYAGIQSAPERVFYLLSCFSEITPETLYHISQNTPLWARALAREANKIVAEICKTHSIFPVPELKQSSLSTRFQKMEREQH